MLELKNGCDIVAALFSWKSRFLADFFHVNFMPTASTNYRPHLERKYSSFWWSKDHILQILWHWWIFLALTQPHLWIWPILIWDWYNFIFRDPGELTKFDYFNSNKVQLRMNVAEDLRETFALFHCSNYVCLAACYIFLQILKFMLSFKWWSEICGSM